MLQFWNAFAGACNDGDNGRGDVCLEQVSIDFYSRIFCEIDHIECNDRGDTKLKYLRSEIEIADEVGCVKDKNHQRGF